MKKKTLKRILLLLAIPLLFIGLAFIWTFGGQAYDHFQGKKYRENLQPTASENVQVLTDTVSIPFLNEKRTLYIYLPPNYASDSLKHYPVLYFLDGQSLFDDKVLQDPEWQLDEVIDNADTKAIVIGIANTDQRMQEYMPYPRVTDKDSIQAYGQRFANWMATDLKSWVDTHYRTQPGAASTSIGGASLGGLMAWYMFTHFPDTYHNAFVFSPSLWANEAVYALHEKIDHWDGRKVYISAGFRELPMLADALKLKRTLRKAGVPRTAMRSKIIWLGSHWHPTWRKSFADAYPWIMDQNQ